jgi:hypothetical protein
MFVQVPSAMRAANDGLEPCRSKQVSNSLISCNIPQRDAERGEHMSQRGMDLHPSKLMAVSYWVPREGDV